MSNRVKYAHTNVDNEAAHLWEDIYSSDQTGTPLLSRVDRFHEKIVPHEKSVLFGYADVTLAIRTASGMILPLKLRGIVVKSLKGNPHLDMPAEKGADNEYYDIFMPRSGGFRTVLTTLVFSDPEVQATIAKAANAPAQESAGTPASAPAASGEFSDDNPFAPGA